MNFFAMTYSAGDRHPMFWPLVFSLTGHMLLFGLILYSPTPDFENSFFPSVIDVQMVEMPAGVPAAEKKANSASDKVPLLDKSAPVPAPDAKAAQEAEVSTAPPHPKTKTALKYKTFKSKRVLKNTLERLEQKVETSPPKPLEDTIKRLREQVEKEGRPESTGAVAAEGAAEGKKEGYAVGSKQEGEAIDIYRLEVAYAINKNWAFAEQLAGGGDKLMATLVFKVMPDGRIEDIFFTDRSGNPYLDDSAYKAILKSSPVKPHPDKLNRPYIEMGLRFTPKGVQ